MRTAAVIANIIRFLIFGFPAPVFVCANLEDVSALVMWTAHIVYAVSLFLVVSLPDVRLGLPTLIAQHCQQPRLCIFLEHCIGSLLGCIEIWVEYCLSSSLYGFLRWPDASCNAERGVPFTRSETSIDGSPASLTVVLWRDVPSLDTLATVDTIEWCDPNQAVLTPPDERSPIKRRVDKAKKGVKSMCRKLRDTTRGARRIRMPSTAVTIPATPTRIVRPESIVPPHRVPLTMSEIADAPAPQHWDSVNDSPYQYCQASPVSLGDGIGLGITLGGNVIPGEAASSSAASVYQGYDVPTYNPDMMRVSSAIAAADQEAWRRMLWPAMEITRDARLSVQPDPFIDASERLEPTAKESIAIATTKRSPGKMARFKKAIRSFSIGSSKGKKRSTFTSA